MNNRIRRRCFLIYLLLFAVTMTVILLSIMLGSVRIKPWDILRILLGWEMENDMYRSILINIRIPRVLAAISGGICLSISGLLLQIFFHNPIVEPYVLGISSGASLFVGFVVLGGYTFGMTTVTPTLLFIGAFLGAMLVMMAVVIAAKRVKNTSTLLIIGIMAGFICSAITSILISFADKEKIAGFVMWTMGSYSGFSWDKIKLLYLISGPIIIVTFFISKPLNAMLMGENYATTMGLNTKSFRILIIIFASILTAVVTAFAGPISFIGLAVPHMTRLIFRVSDNKILIPGVILLGTLLSSICDLCARMLLSPVELPLSAITSLIGAPIIVYLLTRKKNEL